MYGAALLHTRFSNPPRVRGVGHQATVFHESHPSRFRRAFKLPDRKGFGGSAITRRTLLYGQDGSAAIDVARVILVHARGSLAHFVLRRLMSDGVSRVTGISYQQRV